MALPRFWAKGVAIENVCSLTQRQIQLRMAGTKVQLDRTAADERRATIRMKAVGQTSGASATRRQRPLSGRKSGPETHCGIENGKANDAYLLCHWSTIFDVVSTWNVYP